MIVNKDIEEILSNEDYIEPETIRQLRGEDTASLEVLKDMTRILITKTRAPFIDFYVFENIVHVLNGMEPDVENVQGSTPEQIWFALLTIKDMLGKEPDLSHEVKTYIRFIYRDNGCLFLPNIGFDKEDDPLLEQIQEREAKGNLIEDANPIENQAIKYARILEYIKQKG